MSSEQIDRPSTLAGRLAKISAEVGAIAKSGRNAQQGYAFIEYAQVAAEIRKIQDKYGVAIIPEIGDYTVTKVQTSKGAAGYHYLLNMVFKIFNVDDTNDKQEVKWLGEATDYGDKGVNKAITSAVKYFVMRLYNISEKGEKEADAETPEQVVQKTAQKPKIDYAFLAKVRGKLPTISTTAELENYWKELNLSNKYASLLQKDFAKRKGEINVDAA